jgi:hypothetical protein
MLPTLEIAMAEALAATIIESCGAMGSMSNIIGFNTQPADEIVTSTGSGAPKECSGGAEDCYVVHSEWTVYVVSSATGVANDMFLYLATVLAGGNESVVAGYVDSAKYPSFVSINHLLQDVSSASPVTSPSASPASDDSPTKSPTAKTGMAGLFDIDAHMNNVNEYRDRNTLVFYGMIFAGGIAFVFCCSCFCKICCGKKRRRHRRYDSDSSSGLFF